MDKNVADAVTIFLDKLAVTSIPGSLAVQITFTSKDPYRAATIANTLVDEYVALKLTQKQAAQQKLTEWLDSRLQTLSDYVVQAETEIEQYKNENNLTSGKRDLLSAEQLSEQSEELISAAAALAVWHFDQ